MKNSPTEQCPSDSQSPPSAKWWDDLTIDEYLDAASYCTPDEWNVIGSDQSMESAVSL